MLRKTVRFGLLAVVALPLAACGGEGSYNTSVESVRQPVVSTTSYVYDVRMDGAGLSAAEHNRLSGWLDSLNVGYGDSLAIATNGATVPYDLQKDIAALVGHRGMMIGEDNSAQAGMPPPGALRLILRRSTASVPGCPDWSTRQESDMVGGTSSNYGCGVNGNLAAMVANPEDLVRGESSNSALRTDTSNRAIDTYRKQTPTGAGGLKSISAGGN
ncbi:MAG: pilus assembly protein CpaD [Sphingobium sp. 32-64-5]|nr:MAG: pilus assembly protein CpaD [Sphingobium sp. 32-64-5]